MRRVLLWLLLLALPSSLLAAPSKQFTAPGIPITFGDAGQTPVGGGTLVQLSFAPAGTGLTAGTGRISNRYDKGSGSQPSLYELRCQVSLTGTNTLRQDVQFLVSTSDTASGAVGDAGLGSTDASFTVSGTLDPRPALQIVGTLVVYQTTTNTTMYASFRNVYIPSRYFSVVVYNNTSLPFESSTTKHRCVAYPMPFEMQ